MSALTKLSGFSLRIGVAGEYSKETGGLLWKGKALEGNMPKLAGEFNEVAGEVSDLRCLNEHPELDHFVIPVPTLGQSYTFFL